MRKHRTGLDRLRVPATSPVWVSALLLAVVGPAPASAQSGGRYFWPGRARSLPRPTAVVVAPPAAVGAVNNYGRLGTFYPTPYAMIRGNAPAGGGYTPLNAFGDASMSIYGPLSGFRTTSAPVLTYTRGYDGRAVVAPGTAFSNPNLPPLSPVVYPTQGTYYYGFRQSGNPPWWGQAVNWIDQN